MAVVVYKNANKAAAWHVDTISAVRKVSKRTSILARLNLAGANATTRITPSGYFPATIEDETGASRWGYTEWVILQAPNAMALEFGHQPSGVFAGTDTKPPDGEYILTKAAYGG